MALKDLVLLVVLVATACDGASDARQSTQGLQQASDAHPTARDVVERSSQPSPMKLDVGEQALFSKYAAWVLADSRQECVVGAETDEDGMNQKPVAKLIGPRGQELWATALPFPADYYQGRATHCAASGGFMFVLLQLDTQPMQTQSQTHLQIAKLRLADGVAEKIIDIGVPGVSAAYSAWVSSPTSNFFLEAGKLIIVGEYTLFDGEGEHRHFRAAIDAAAIR